MIKLIIKLVLSIIVVLALIGGAIDFVATPESWSLVVDKETALSSVKNGVVRIYDFFVALGGGDESVKNVDLPLKNDSQY